MPVRTVSLSSATLRSPGERLEGWHEVQAPLFDVDLADGRQAVLDWRFQLYHLGVSVCGQTRSSDQRIRRTASSIAGGNCDHVFIDYLIDCDMAGESAGKTFQAKSGDIVLFDMACPIAFDIAAPNQSQGGWRTAFVMIPRAHFQASCDMRNLHGLVLKKHSPIGQVVRGHIRTLVAAAGALEESDVEAMGRGSAAFLAQALAGATYRAPRDERAFTDVTLLRVRHFIDGRLGQPGLSPDHIARGCAISRAALYRLFEPLGGVAAYVRRQRLLRAKRDLASIALDGQTISAIARRNGFIDDASFRRAFRQAFGVSASDVRSHRTAAGASVLAGGKTISDWVRDL